MRSLTLAWGSCAWTVALSWATMSHSPSPAAPPPAALAMITPPPPPPRSSSGDDRDEEQQEEVTKKLGRCSDDGEPV